MILLTKYIYPNIQQMHKTDAFAELTNATITFVFFLFKHCKEVDETFQVFILQCQVFAIVAFLWRAVPFSF